MEQHLEMELQVLHMGLVLVQEEDIQFTDTVDRVQL